MGAQGQGSGIFQLSDSHTYSAVKQSETPHPPELVLLSLCSTSFLCSFCLCLLNSIYITENDVYLCVSKDYPGEGFDVLMLQHRRNNTELLLKQHLAPEHLLTPSSPTHGVTLKQLQLSRNLSVPRASWWFQSHIPGAHKPYT